MLPTLAILELVYLISLSVWIVLEKRAPVATIAWILALAALPGIGPGKAARLLAAVELGRRALTRPLPKGRRLVSSRDVDAALRPRLAREEVEHFVAIPLDAKHRPTGTLRLSTGSLVACPVEPATVFRALVRHAAAAVVFVHNHPSGHPEPSPEDVALTRRLCDAGDLLGVEVLDHVIIGAEGYFSFLDAGLLAAPSTTTMEDTGRARASRVATSIPRP